MNEVVREFLLETNENLAQLDLDLVTLEKDPTERETLTSRLIDRPIRPLFPDGFTNEVQVVATVVSLDPDIDAEDYLERDLQKGQRGSSPSR